MKTYSKLTILAFVVLFFVKLFEPTLYHWWVVFSPGILFVVVVILMAAIVGFYVIAFPELGIKSLNQLIIERDLRKKG